MNKVNKIKGLCISAVIPILFLATWQILSIRIDNRMILPRLDSVVELLLSPNESLVGTGSLIFNLRISLVRVLIGYVIAITIGVPLGIMIGYSEFFKKLLLPFLNLFRPIPPLAWVPLVLAWFGVASFATVFRVESGSLYTVLNNLKLSMVFIIFLGAFFPILTNTIFGIKNVKKTLIDSAMILGASRKHIILKILIPAAMPSILTGFKIGLGISWMCLISAEMLPGSVAGIGYLITHSYQVSRVDIVILGIVAISIVGIFFEILFSFLEKRFFEWQSKSK